MLFFPAALRVPRVLYEVEASPIHTQLPDMNLEGKVETSPRGLAQPPHLHLNIGVGQVVLRRQLAVIVDKVVQDGGAQDGLQQGQQGVRKGSGWRPGP